MNLLYLINATTALNCLAGLVTASLAINWGIPYPLLWVCLAAVIIQVLDVHKVGVWKGHGTLTRWLYSAGIDFSAAVVFGILGIYL